MERHLNHKEAWEDFYKWMKGRKDSGELARIPGDVQEAQYAYTDKRDYPLGVRRIETLLLKYASGRYRIETNFILIEPENDET